MNQSIQATSDTVLCRWFLPQKAIFAWHQRKCYFNSTTIAFSFVSSEARKFKKWSKFAIKALNMSIQKTYLSFKLYLLETWVSEVSLPFSVKIKLTHKYHQWILLAMFLNCFRNVKISPIRKYHRLYRFTAK